MLTDLRVASSADIEELPAPSPALFGFHFAPLLSQPLYFHDEAEYSRFEAFTVEPSVLPSFSHSVSTNGFHVEPTWKPLAPLWELSTLKLIWVSVPFSPSDAV